MLVTVVYVVERYVDGWRIDKDLNRINHVNDFLDEVRQEYSGLTGNDFNNNSIAGLLLPHIHGSEKNDIIDVVPTELK